MPLLVLPPNPRVRGKLLEAVGALAKGISVDREVDGSAKWDEDWVSETPSQGAADDPLPLLLCPPTCVTGLPGIVSSHSKEFSYELQSINELKVFVS